MWSPTQASCCDHGFHTPAWHVVVSPARGFSITTSRAQPITTQTAIVTMKYREAIALLLLRRPAPRRAVTFTVGALGSARCYRRPPGPDDSAIRHPAPGT